MTKIPYQLTSVPVDGDFTTSPADWLVAQAQAFGLRYLLAHADDGVIWGRVDGDGPHTSHGIAPASPPLRASTLQQARLFGPAGELLLWRDDDGLRARVVTEVPGNDDDIIDEDQILWGDAVEAVEDSFTLLREGAQGMRHAVPIVVTDEQLNHHQLRLRVRHYITENEDGEASVTLSRLVQLLPEA
jgi:CRISPR-associated protein (TIGR03984 family)